MSPIYWEMFNNPTLLRQHWKARAEKAEKRWELVKSKFPGVAETIEDLIEKEEGEKR
jgi:hypothetical protein